MAFDIMEYFKKITTFSQKKQVRLFLPFALLLVGGSLALREFAQLRFSYNPVSFYDVRAEAKKLGIKVKEPGEVTIETEYEKLKEMDIDNWKNVRIPRPWEENTEGVK